MPAASSVAAAKIVLFLMVTTPVNFSEHMRSPSRSTPLPLLEQRPESFRILRLDDLDDAMEGGLQPLEGNRRMGIAGLDFVVDVRALPNHRRGKRLKRTESCAAHRVFGLG